MEDFSPAFAVSTLSAESILFMQKQHYRTWGGACLVNSLTFHLRASSGGSQFSVDVVYQNQQAWRRKQPLETPSAASSAPTELRHFGRILGP
ncbi:hypothetical protein AV530_002191 [Patagioenas fasciata monilis]|uniref:Uncharacterized protein n=1 Tax=Patagioenas fasciata monilis TaxID=372326 RepID=A0A1V4K5P9_PATFA|nr:hypothetical protein AV530_002191 [Patagioenas fasciata monilis]